MRLGILADSHGRSDTTRNAVEALKANGASLLIHLGDVCDDTVLDELAGHETRIVFGNCDYDIAGLTRYAENLGLKVDHPMGTIDVDGKTIAFTHGHIARLMMHALENEVSYLLHGHSHELRDERTGSTRIINPGALCRATRYTAALLTPATDELEIIEIPKD